MKTRVELEYNPVFVDVGRRIAKGEPPLWLLIGLNHFSGQRKQKKVVRGGIGIDLTDEDHRFFETQISRMRDAADTLMKWLPIWKHAGYGIQCPKEVAVVLDALPRIKKDLDGLDRKQMGRRPKVQREICAAVVVEAWKIIHGRAEPRSLKLQEACKEYWLACGGQPISEENDPENWRRPVEQALATDHLWVREILEAVQNST
jgi:hypothetical protein